MACITLLKKLPLSSCDPPVGLTAWNTIPDSTYSLLQLGSPSTIHYKFPHLVEFLFTARFKTTRVMKHKVRIALKHQLILNVMVSTLQ